MGITWPAAAPRFYRIGQDVELNLSSLAMTVAGRRSDPVLNVKVGDKTLDPTPVDNTLSTTPFDKAGDERRRTSSSRARRHGQAGA